MTAEAPQIIFNVTNLNVILFILHLLLRVAAFKTGIVFPGGSELPLIGGGTLVWFLVFSGILLTWVGPSLRMNGPGTPNRAPGLWTTVS